MIRHRCQPQDKISVAGDRGENGSDSEKEDLQQDSQKPARTEPGLFRERQISQDGQQIDRYQRRE